MAIFTAAWAALGGAHLAWGQCPAGLVQFRPEDLPGVVLQGAFGYAPVQGNDGRNIYGAKSLQAGAGMVLTSLPAERCLPKDRIPHVRWLLNFNFLYSGHNANPQLAKTAFASNPLYPALLAATNAKADYYAGAIEPTIRFVPGPTFGAYAFAGVGWMRRTIDFTGPGTEGPLQQAGNVQIFSQAADSASCDAGLGVDWAFHRRWRLFVEARVIQGLAVNGKSRLIPLEFGIRW